MGAAKENPITRTTRPRKEPVYIENRRLLAVEERFTGKEDGINR